jgi:hypothetical protein
MFSNNPTANNGANRLIINSAAKVIPNIHKCKYYPNCHFTLTFFVMWKKDSAWELPKNDICATVQPNQAARIIFHMKAAQLVAL